MHDEEREASIAAAALAVREHEARRSRLWPRCLLLLPLPSEWPPGKATRWARYAFALGPPRTSVHRGRQEEHVLISKAWGVVRHEGSLRAAPSFESLSDEPNVDGDADVAAAAEAGSTSPSVGALLLRAIASELTPSEERRLAGTYLANLDRVACTLPRAARAEHAAFLAWLERWRAERPAWIAHDPSDLFADPVADRIAEAEAKQKKLEADVESELAALKRTLGEPGPGPRDR